MSGHSGMQIKLKRTHDSSEIWKAIDQLKAAHFNVTPVMNMSSITITIYPYPHDKMDLIKNLCAKYRV